MTRLEYRQSVGFTKKQMKELRKLAKLSHLSISAAIRKCVEYHIMTTTWIDPSVLKIVQDPGYAAKIMKDHTFKQTLE